MSENGDFEAKAESEAVQFIGEINRLSELFDNLCAERHTEGQGKYGKLTFLGNDVVRMMLEELADTANYCRYQAIKLMLLQEALERQIAGSGLIEDGEEQIMLGVQAFKGVKDVGWGNKK